MRRIAVAFLFLSLLPSIAGATVISKINVDGNQRMDDESVRLMLPFKVGDDVSSATMNAGVKKLQQTELFSDVKVSLDGSVVNVKIQETATVNMVTVEGNDAISTDDLKKEIRLGARQSYNTATIGADVQRILTLYQRQGYFETVVRPKKIQLLENRVNVVYEINEGRPTMIDKIEFEGNHIFSDSVLRGVILSRETAWWKIMTSFDVYDEDRIMYDQQLLRQHYLKNGYVDFQIKKAEGFFSENRASYSIKIIVEEGPRYKLGNVEVKNPFPDVKDKDVFDVITVDKGDYYNVDEVEKSVSKLREKVSDSGYSFVKVDVMPEKHDNTRTIDLVFDIQKTHRMYINALNITGNLRTFDYVIERNMKMQEKDPFSLQGAEIGRQRLMRTQYFKTVEMTPSRLEGTNLINLDVKVEEQPTGELSGGIGWSNINGIMFDAGITEKNFMGRGQIVSLRAVLAEYQTQYAFSFTEPYMFGRSLMGGIDVSYTTYDYMSLGSYKYDRDTFGVTGRLGWDLTDHWYQSLRMNAMWDKNYNIYTGWVPAELYTLSTQFKYYNLDTDFVQNTHTGVVSTINIGYTGFGGTESYMKYDFGITGMLNFWDNRWQLKAEFNAGLMDPLGSDDYVSRVYRYFLGGESLRGFEVAGVGARLWANQDYALGGLWKINGTFQLNFPVFIPDEYQFKGFVFYDYGVLGEPPSSDMEYAGIDNLYSDRLRQSVGLGVYWKTPMGPMNFSWGFPITKEDYDREQLFLLSFETQF